MNAIKQIFLTLSLFSVIMPIRAMEQGDSVNQGFFGKMWNFAKEHPVVAGLGVAASLAGVYVYKNHLQAKRNQALFDAARDGDIAGIKAALVKGAHINAKSPYYHHPTALHKAAAAGHLEVVKYLVACGADIKEKYCSGNSALHSASGQGHLQVVQFLLKAGLDINDKGNDNRTALQNASFYGHLEVVKYLVMSRADINAKNDYGSTALHGALRFDRLNVVSFLLDQGPFDDGSAFDIALSSQDADLILAMIQRSHFVALNVHTEESQKRLQSTMLISKAVGLSKDLGKKIVSFMPEDLVSADHAKVVYSYVTDIKELVAHCPIRYFNKIYQNIYDSDKPAFLAKVVPAIVEYRLSKAKERLEGKTSDDPVIASIIDIATIGQHRAAITKHVTNGILGIEEEPELVAE